MKNTIYKTLEELEKLHHIKILLAVESGSRAWGFPSNDSDFDVRFLYIRSKKDYLKLNEDRDFISYNPNKELDVIGWDVKKFLKLLYTSNATSFEWLQSPIFYRKENEIYQMISELLPHYDCQQTLMYHYLGLVRKKQHVLDKDPVILKDFFYLFRSLMAAKFTYEYNHFPPMEFEKLIQLVEDEKIIKEALKLIRLKSMEDEDCYITLQSPILNYLNETYQYLNSACKTKRKGTTDVEPLNQLFLKILDYDHNRIS